MSLPCASRPKKSAPKFAPKLPPSLTAEREGDIAILRLSRPQKRNALDDATILGIESFFTALPKDIKAVVMHGAGRAFLRRPRSQRTDRARHRRGVAALAACGIACSIRSSSARCRWSPCCTARWSAAGSNSRRRAISASPSARPITRCRRAAAASILGGGGSVRLPRLIGVVAGDGHDADRPHLWRRRRPDLSGCRTIWSTTARASPRASSSPSASPPTRRCQLRHHARAAAHRRERSRQRAISPKSLMASIAPGQRRGQDAAEGFSGEARQARCCVAEAMR